MESYCFGQIYTRNHTETGLDEFLQLLKKQHIKIGIATSNSRLLLDAFLDARNLTGCIDAITTSCDVNKGKPEPDVYLKTAEKLAVSPTTLSGV